MIAKSLLLAAGFTDLYDRLDGKVDATLNGTRFVGLQFAGFESDSEEVHEQCVTLKIKFDHENYK